MYMYMCVYPERVPRAHGPTIVPLSSRRSSARTAEAAATANPMGKAAVRAMPRARNFILTKGWSAGRTTRLFTKEHFTILPPLCKKSRQVFS